jgi:hypothetical protein
MGLGIETDFDDYDFSSSLDILNDDDRLEGRLAERGERQDFNQGSEHLKSSDIEKRRFSERFVDPERGIEKLLAGVDKMSPSPEMLTYQLETIRVLVDAFGRFSYPSTPPTATFQVKATSSFQGSPLASVLNQLNGGEPGDSMGFPCPTDLEFSGNDLELVTNGIGRETC